VRYAAALDRWFKSTLKKWAQREYAARHDPDYAAMEKARAKIQRKYERNRAQMRELQAWAARQDRHEHELRDAPAEEAR
jgi:hypothetical protein